MMIEKLEDLLIGFKANSNNRDLIHIREYNQVKGRKIIILIS